MRAFTSILVFTGINSIQCDAAELQDSNSDNATMKAVRIVDNLKYGWSDSNVGACDQNNYDMFYS